jgi:RNA polymerase sigma factor (sigma-70 family)
MNTQKEAFIHALLHGNMMDSIFGYAYKRCFSKSEAEELCQEIITEVLFALSKNINISNLNAYIWQIANNTYINHINKNKRIHRMDYSNAVYASNMEDDILNRIVDQDNLACIKREIAALSAIYRDVLIMYYLDELPMSAIAKQLNIPENRVKQRLYTAREKIKKGVFHMNTTKQEQNVKLYDLMLTFWEGDLFKYDPRDKVHSLLRKNIIFLCRKKAKSVKELSKELNIPPEIISDELSHIPEDFIKKTENGKYIANTIVIETELQEKMNQLTADITADYFKEVKAYLLSKKDELMALPYINPPKSFEYLLWWYLPQFASEIKHEANILIEEKLKEKNIQPEERKTIIVCTVLDPAKKKTAYKGKNHNGIWNVFNMLGQNEEVRIENISVNNYLPWEKGRFFAGQNFGHFPELAMVFKTINGLDMDNLPGPDKEAAAKALEKGYIRKENGKLYPEIPIADHDTWWKLMASKHGDIRCILGVNPMTKLNNMHRTTKKYAEKIANTIWGYADKYLPGHLHYLISIFASGSMHMEYYLYEEGVKDGILYIPPETACTEGIFASIHHPNLNVMYEEAEKIFNNKITPTNNFLSEYKISQAAQGKNALGARIGLQPGDIMTAVNGVPWLTHLKNNQKATAYDSHWKENDIITVARNGETIDLTVTF